MQLYGVVGDLAEAEDVVQEAFVRATAAGRRFRAVDNHEAWLRRTAINLQRNRWRKLRNFSRIKHRLEHPADAPGLEEHVVVIEALRALPEPQRQVLALLLPGRPVGRGHLGDARDRRGHGQVPARAGAARPWPLTLGPMEGGLGDA